MTFEADTQAREELDGFASILGVVLRRRRILLLAPPLIALLMGTVLFLMPRSYSARVVFLPKAEGTSSTVAGLAAQIGLSLPTGSAASPRVFEALVHSNQIVREVVLSQYSVVVRRGLPFARDTVRVAGTLLDLLEVEGDSEEERIQKGMRALRDRLAARTDDLAGTVDVRVRMPWSSLSFAVITRLIESVQRFNLESRQSQAGAERRFVEARLATATADLRQVEDSLQYFLARNREFRSSASLVFEHDRLQRSVGLRQQVATTLAQAVEQARIAEIRDTPVINILDEPMAPVKPDRRGIIIKTIGLYVIVLGFFVVIAFTQELVQASTGKVAHRPGELLRLWDEAKDDFRRLLTRESRRRGST